MSRRPAVDSIANPDHPYWRAPRAFWLVAGAPTAETYPCMCQGTGPCRRPTQDAPGCRCWGRVDAGVVALPANCCAAKAAALATVIEGTR